MSRAGFMGTYEELVQYAEALEELVVDLYAMTYVELETRGFTGFLGRSYERAEIARRMVELGFVGSCEEDAEACQNAAKAAAPEGPAPSGECEVDAANGPCPMRPARITSTYLIRMGAGLR